jgi:CubicO group peptidase (beta-lactamase class C family)
MSTLQEVVDEQVAEGRVPGAVALMADRNGAVEVGVGGVRAAGGDDPIARWLPELADPVVLRDPSGPLDDVVPAVRPITVRHLLTSTHGHGFPADFSWPVVEVLLDRLHQGAPQPDRGLDVDEWARLLGEVPLLAQPGERFLYNTSLDVLGVLLARIEGAPLGEVLADTVLGPLGVDDTGFWVGPERVGRMAAQHERIDGELVVTDPPDGQWSRPPRFPSGAGGLVSTADDWLAFGRMLLADGAGPDGRAVLSPASVRLMATSHVEAEPGNPFLQGQGWGFGGGVDLTASEPWTVPGRYGWIGGTGTAGYVIPARGRVVVWLGQVQLAGPDDFTSLAAGLTHAARP